MIQQRGYSPSPAPSALRRDLDASLDAKTSIIFTHALRTAAMAGPCLRSKITTSVARYKSKVDQTGKRTLIGLDIPSQAPATLRSDLSDLTFVRFRITDRPASAIAALARPCRRSAAITAVEKDALQFRSIINGEISSGDTGQNIY